MSFDTLLSPVLDNVYGARGIVFLANDGEVVFQVAQRGVRNLDLLAAYHGITLATCSRFVDDAALGSVSVIICEYRNGLCLLKSLNDGYSLVLLLAKDGNLGYALHLLNSLGPSLNAEIGE